MSGRVLTRKEVRELLEEGRIARIDVERRIAQMEKAPKEPVPSQEHDMNKQQYVYFIVLLTKQGKLLDAYVRGASISEAMDKLLGQLDLKPGDLVDFKFCLKA